MGLGEPYGLPAVTALGDDVDVGLGGEESRETGAHDRLVVGDQHSDHGRGFCPTGSSACTAKPPSVRGPAAKRPPSMVARSRIPTSPCPITLVRSSTAVTGTDEPS